MVREVGTGSRRAREEIPVLLRLELAWDCMLFLLFFLFCFFKLILCSVLLTIQTGISYEYSYKIAELMDANPYYNIPHLAGDSWIQGLAEFLYPYHHFLSRIFLDFVNAYKRQG